MALLYAKPVEYAIRALTYLAGKETDRSTSVIEIAEHENISSHHLSKVMKALARGKYVRALRGPGGGYQLLVNPKEVTLWDIMGCLSAQEGFSECAIGWAECSDENPCPLHTRWMAVRQNIETYLKDCTISDLALATEMKEGAGFNRGPLQIRVPSAKD
ncbi:MAG: Rrf2 family transcriptional regulator [Candidatus Omnitrophica bacterium]|nr:Rrf2 family transcriptional regulator [Candidatus Omnitrophota bacterium]MCA9417307.1 Rrf2 family transcriptional regulator [Candidatus Omnitrophota bacterium]MCA9423830.1 Rrf2 family transcriptional regulator [Candidatus Omnitrophota bacterium]MCA9430183.1 Rrf2 family transcriptional regulator [Candidatus Omnitrophota bacterium]MCA9434195.1 Rrf2 family transcriptional regulator [Candidatus Omnitrophota bacterium]